MPDRQIDRGRGVTERKGIEREIFRQKDRWRKRGDREKGDRKRGCQTDR